MKTPSVTIFLKGIPLPSTILRDDIPATFLPEERTNSLEYADKYLASLDRDTAKAKKIDFVRRYASSMEQDELSVLSVKNQFEHLTLADITLSSSINYAVTQEDDPCGDSLSIGTGDNEIVYPAWIMLFNLDKSAISRHAVDLRTIHEKFNGMVVHHVEQDDQQILHVTIQTSETLDAVNKMESELLKTHIKGVPGIGRTMVRREARDIKLADGSVIQRETDQYGRMSEIMMTADNYIVDTVGTNLLDIVAMPYVDCTRTYTNDINEICEIYGIEMARKAIIREITDVMENAGASVDVRHIEILADAMTCGGFLQKIDRYGARKGEAGPLALASFEETTSVLSEAAAFGRVDNIAGVSPNIMLGQFGKVGTGSFRLYMDETIIMTHCEQAAPQARPTVESMATATGCRPEDFQMIFRL